MSVYFYTIAYLSMATSTLQARCVHILMLAVVELALISNVAAVAQIVAVEARQGCAEYKAI